MAEAKLKILMELEENISKGVASVKSGLAGVSDKAKEMQPTFTKMAAIGTAGFAAISGAAIMSIKAYSESEEQLARVDQSLRNMSDKTLKQFGGSMELAQKTARDFGSDMQRLGGIGDETAAEGFSKLLLVTQDQTKAMDAARVAADLATFKQIDYGTAVDAVGKVLNGNVGALKKLGIEVDENMTKDEAMAALQARVAGQYEASGKTIAGQSRIMKESFGDLQENIGQALIPAIQKIMEVVQPILQTVVKWASENPKLVATIGAIAAGLFALIAVVGTLGLALPAIIAGFTLLLGPIGLVGLAIAALIAIVVLVIKNWDTITAFAQQIWGNLVNFFTGIWEAIQSSITASWEAIKNFFIAVWDAIKLIFQIALFGIVGIVLAIFDAMGIDLVAVFETIKVFIMAFWEAVKLIFNAAVQIVSLAWQKLWTGIRDFLGPIIAPIKNAITGMWNWIKDTFNALAGPISDAWGKLWQGLTNSVSIAWDAVKSVVKDSINWIIDKINAVIASINSVVSRGAGALGMGAGPQIPNIPRLADGGIVRRPTLALIGEAGPEAVVPLGRLAGAGGGGVNIFISGNEFLGDPREVAMKLGRELVDYLKDNMRL